MRWFIPVAACAALGVSSAQGQAPAPAWGPAPAVFPAGSRMAVLQGDPGKAGEFTVRLEMPDGYRIAAHSHPSDEFVTVIEGTLMYGMGDTLKVDKTAPLPSGGYVNLPAHMNHYVITKGRTVVQVHSRGPFQLTYVNPADDPSGQQQDATHP